MAIKKSGTMKSLTKGGLSSTSKATVKLAAVLRTPVEPSALISG